MDVVGLFVPVILVGLLAFIWSVGAGIDMERQARGAGLHLSFAGFLWIVSVAAAVGLGRSL
jgi:hypothetical protein